jgi:hypothetical protein
MRVLGFTFYEAEAEKFEIGQGMEGKVHTKWYLITSGQKMETINVLIVTM